MLDSYQIPLIVNDDINLCVKLDALGVHLGQSDDGVMKARLALGPDKIIGLSIDNIEQIKKSKTQPINYVGIGAIFHTNSKPEERSLARYAAHLATSSVVVLCFNGELCLFHLKMQENLSIVENLIYLSD